MGDSIDQIETILEMREAERDDAEAALADARSLVRQREEELDEARGKLEGLRREMFNIRQQMGAPDGPEGVADIQRHRMYVEACAVDEAEFEKELDEARHALDDARQKAEAAESTLRAAQRELKAVSEYAERLKTEAEKQKHRRASRQRDETASRVWRENRDE